MNRQETEELIETIFKCQLYMLEIKRNFHNSEVANVFDWLFMRLNISS